MQPSDAKATSEPSQISDANITKALRSLAPRKLGRLLNDAAHPFYILDGRDRVRFVNQALLQVLHATEGELIGLDCTAVTPSDGPRRKWMASLTVPTSMRHGAIALEPIGITSLADAWPARVSISLDSDFGNGSLAVWWLRKSDALVADVFEQQPWLDRADIQSAIANAKQSFPKLDGLFSLVGSSQPAARARHQVKAATESRSSILILGPNGCGKTMLANAIFQSRQRKVSSRASMQSLFTIDCRLMDRRLLSEMLDLVGERTQAGESPEVSSETPIILLKNVHLLASEAFPVLVRFFEQSPTRWLVATSSDEQLSSLHPASGDWQTIVSHLDIQRIELLPLSLRVADIAPMAVAVLESLQAVHLPREKKALSPESIRCLELYGWPGEMRELVQSLEHVLQQSKGSMIQVDDLSLAIRSYASHVLKKAPLEKIDLDQVLQDVERRLIEQAMATFPRNRAEAARHLGISRTRLLRRLTDFGIEAPPEASSSEAKKPPSIQKPARPTKPVETKSNRNHSHTPTPAIDHDSDLPVFEELPEET
jgi:transcriptional regulator with PAS, ATPase and Fis domain